MITKLDFYGPGKFNISAAMQLECVDFLKKDINSEIFFPLLIDKTIRVKKNIYKNLADDNRVNGRERIEVVKTIDELLTVLLAFAFILSPEVDSYSDEYKGYFVIKLKLNNVKYLSGSGKLINTSSEDIEDFAPWMDDKVIGQVKNVISLFSKENNEESIRAKLVELIYNVFALRYKVEYI